VSTCICGRCARVHTCSHCGRRWEPQGDSHCPSCGNPVQPAINGAAEPNPDIRAVESRRVTRLADFSDVLNANSLRRVIIP
jgi:predicted amidophosphoribosyltransferase